MDKYLSKFDYFSPGLVHTMINIVIILLSLLLIRFLLQFLINRIISRVKRQDIGRGGQRFQTVAVLLRSIINVTLFFLAITLTLKEAGVNIGPILAAAGVGGLAIGFGAQSLIKDLLNGFLMILEGNVRVGDWISLENIGRGKVEQITLRTLILRDLEGNLHIIPHGEIKQIINMTIKYATCLVDIGIAYREDADMIIKVLKEEADKLWKDPELGTNIKSEPVVQGLQEFQDSSVVYRVMMETEPGSQWEIKRRYQLFLKRRFDNDGIEIPYPHVTVYMGQDKEGKAPPLRVIGEQESG